MQIDPIDLDPEQCRLRQQRLCEKLEQLRIDNAVLTTAENVQYLTGFRPHRLLHAAVLLRVDGHCVLSAPNDIPDQAAVDDVITFEAQWHATLRQEQPEISVQGLAESLPRSRTGESQRIGVEFFGNAANVLKALKVENRSKEYVVDLDPVLYELRRRKAPDELAMIRRAIECTDAMYARAREVIEPGITELQVFNELQAAAVTVAGEPLTALGNDFQCNSPGGPPRLRAAEAGELFILDLGPCYRGYYADNCRTIAVSGQATEQQQKAWNVIDQVLEMVENSVRPGVSCRQLYDQAKAMLDDYCPGAFSHHLGHGFGLYPHTAPHLNPQWDDVFEEGDTFTAEPGLYTSELKAGIRLEQNYLVTESGVERLTHAALELA